MRLRQIIPGILFLLFINYSCKNNNYIIDDTLPKESIKLKYNVQQQIDDNLTLEITGLEDTRCPVGDVCSDIGYVKVDVRVLSDAETGTSTLYYNEIPNVVQNVDTILGYRIEVIDITPIPYSNKPITSESLYSVFVLVKKL